MSQYQVQVSTVNVLSSTIYQGWTTSTQAVIPPLLNNKGYYWWVRAVDNSADTTGWSAIWKFSTVIAAPALSSPANGMSYTQPLTLSWGTVSGAASYQVEVSASSTFANTVLFQSGKTLTSGSVSGLTANALYYWRAAALTVGVTAWSAAWNFILLGPESAPTLISPANGSISLPPTVNLSWTAVSGTLSYGVQVSTSSFFATTLSDQSCQPDSLTVSGLANGTTFYWRVLSGNMGVSSDWSTSWSFTTIIAAPALSSPRDGMSSTLPVNFTWGTCTNATGYELQVSTSSAFGAPLVDETGQGMTGATVNSPLSGGTYYWRVASSNTTETVWSGIWSFVAVPPPGVPVLSSPTNGSIASIPVTFNWSNSAGTIAYKLSIATSSSFATTVVDQDFANNTATVSVLSLRTTYFWRVSAGGSGGTSAWSGIWSFTTASTGIAIDGLLSRRTNFKIAGNRLEYTLAHECPVDLRICDILGRTLLDLHRVQAEGNYSISLKTPGFGSGLFLVSFKAGTIDMQTVVVGERRRE